jgi:hypothetical protein
MRRRPTQVAIFHVTACHDGQLVLFRPKGRVGSPGDAAIPQPLLFRDTMAREKFGHRRPFPRLRIPALIMQASTLALNASVT